jgi:hypothetical protein
MNKAEFLNCIRSLFCVDQYLLPELTDEQWEKFRDDPFRYFIHADDVQAEAIWRQVEKRQKRASK